MDSSYRLEKVGKCSSRGWILLWRDGFYPKEAKWIYGYGSLSRANTHAVGSSGSMTNWRLVVTYVVAMVRYTEVRLYQK